MKYENILQACLSRVLEGDDSLETVVSEYPQWSDQLRAALETALWLQNQRKEFEPRPGFVRSTRASLPGLIEAGRLKAPDQRIFQPNLLNRVALLIILIQVIFLTGGGLVFVADSALPGNKLYPMKTLVEDVRLALTFDDGKDTQLHLQFAQEHLIICAEMVSQGQNEDALVALRNYENHMVGAGRKLRALQFHDLYEGDKLRNNFNQIYLQDLEILKILFPGVFDVGRT